MHTNQTKHQLLGSATIVGVDSETETVADQSTTRDVNSAAQPDKAASGY